MSTPQIADQVDFLVSIEHNTEWYEKIKNNMEVSQKSYDKITSNTINNYSNKLYVLYEKMKKIIKNVYIETLTQFYKKYSTIFHKMIYCC